MRSYPAGSESLAVVLESPLPASLPPGSATALYCSGTAADGPGPVEDLELLIDGTPHRLDAVRMPRFDMPYRRSGFWGLLPVRAPTQQPRVNVSASVRRSDGRRQEVPLGAIEITAPEPQPARATARVTDGLIAVCMGTFEPDPDLLRAQLTSLRAQSDTRWICVISDDASSPDYYKTLAELVDGDPRFVLSRSARRIGFYRNFERALRLAPREAELIALCDQDDVWNPRKLEVLRASLGDAMLVYSDQRLVDERGVVLRETLWRGRSNNFTNLVSLLIANTVTGAAALFRREVADLALPFPDSPGIEFHDHWLALVALASGELAYVDTPLYDYVQHERAVLGKVSGEPARPLARRLHRPRMRAWRAAYFLGYLPGKVRAATLLLRCGDRMPARKQRGLERYLASDSSPVSFAWFALRSLRALAGRTETLGGELELAAGIVWRIAAAMTASRWWPQRISLDTRFPDPPHFEHKRLRRWRARVWEQPR